MYVLLILPLFSKLPSIFLINKILQTRREPSQETAEYNSSREEEEEYESAADDDEVVQENNVDFLSIHEDFTDVIKRSTLKRNELRAGKYNRSNRHHASAC